MAIHSNILAWEIPWTEEPGRLQSMGPAIDEQYYNPYTDTREVSAE